SSEPLLEAEYPRVRVGDGTRIQASEHALALPLLRHRCQLLDSFLQGRPPVSKKPVTRVVGKAQALIAGQPCTRSNCIFKRIYLWANGENVIGIAGKRGLNTVRIRHNHCSRRGEIQRRVTRMR